MEELNDKIKIREELYEKMEEEYNSFIEGLKKCKPEKIIDMAYEKVVKEELCLMFYPEFNIYMYDINQLRALNKLKEPLEALYEGWMKSDRGVHEVFEDIILGVLDELSAGLVSYNIGFIDDSGKQDETQFDIPIGDITELMNLFHDFCKENNIHNAKIVYVELEDKN